MQAHVGVPSLYINIDAVSDEPRDSKDPTRTGPGPQQPQKAIVPFDRFRIVRNEVKGGKRIVGEVKREVTGKITQQQHVVKTTITHVSGGWLKLTPTEPLAPGEYTLVEMKENEDPQRSEGMNLYVWDFGVNPKAPANANPWKPNTPELKK
jgi:hypothetical protein